MLSPSDIQEAAARLNAAERSREQIGQLSLQSVSYTHLTLPTIYSV